MRVGRGLVTGPFFALKNLSVPFVRLEFERMLK